MGKKEEEIQLKENEVGEEDKKDGGKDGEEEEDKKKKKVGRFDKQEIATMTDLGITIDFDPANGQMVEIEHNLIWSGFISSIEEDTKDLVIYVLDTLRCDKGWFRLERQSPEVSWPSIRTQHSFTIVHGVLYMFGGKNGSANDELWRFDPLYVRWDLLDVQGDDRPEARHGHTAVVRDDNELIIFGGQGVDNQDLKDMWVLDTKEGSRLGLEWKKIEYAGSLPDNVASNLCYYEGKIMAMNQQTFQFYFFDFESSTWTEIDYYIGKIIIPLAALAPFGVVTHRARTV